MRPISVALDGAADPVVPTDGLLAEIEPVIGSGLVALTPCKLPEPSMKPTSVLEAGAAEALVPTEGFVAVTDAWGYKKSLINLNPYFVPLPLSSRFH